MLPYVCNLAVYKPGPFESDMTLFVEDNGIREIVLTVRGNGRASGEPRDETPPKP